MISTREIEQLHDRGSVLDSKDNKIGKVEQIFLDDETSEPEWVTVNTGLFGGAASFVPLRGARVQGEDLVVAFIKDKVKDAPRVDDADKHLSRDEEAELYRYYGREYTDYTGGPEQRGGAKAAGRATSGDNDATMTRSEKQVHVGTEQVSARKVRLRKHIVTQNVTTTVPVSHGEVRLERESITAEHQVPEEVRKQQIDTNAADRRGYQPRHRRRRRRFSWGTAEGTLK